MLLADFSTCELSDALLKLGLSHGGHVPDICLVNPDDRTVRIAGPAFTVRFVLSSDDSAPPKPKDHHVDVAPAGSVIVISVPSQAKNAVWGGLMTAGAEARGVVGVVISGRYRDALEHGRFPVFARGRSTLGQSPFTRPAALNVPLTISPEGEDISALEPVTIQPADWIVADCNGVVCVPAELVERTVEQAKISREVDDRCMQDIRAGTGVQASFKKHRS